MIVGMRALRMLLPMLLCTLVQAQGLNPPLSVSQSQPVTLLQSQALLPPAAERRPQLIKSEHGSRSDDYLWLRDVGA